MSVPTGCPSTQTPAFEPSVSPSVAPSVAPPAVALESVSLVWVSDAPCSGSHPIDHDDAVTASKRTRTFRARVCVSSCTSSRAEPADDFTLSKEQDPCQGESCSPGGSSGPTAAGPSPAHLCAHDPRASPPEGRSGGSRRQGRAVASPTRIDGTAGFVCATGRIGSPEHPTGVRAPGQRPPTVPLEGALPLAIAIRRTTVGRADLPHDLRARRPQACRPLTPATGVDASGAARPSGVPPHSLRWG